MNLAGKVDGWTRLHPMQHKLDKATSAAETPRSTGAAQLPAQAALAAPKDPASLDRQLKHLLQKSKAHSKS